MCCRVLSLLLAVICASGAFARDVTEISAICDQAGSWASQQTGVPRSVLQAITLTETGRKIAGAHRPWPWTVNMEGTGKWFATRQEALDYVMEHYNKGARSFDVGCFQINYRWHGNAFASIEDMFDPKQNALYAGRFLRNLYGETKSWSKSAGAYHSRTPKYATRYSARFDRILAGLTGQKPPPAPAPGTEYAHHMSEVPAQPTSQEVPLAEPEVPQTPWVPPPPSAFGSVAAVEHLPAGPPLLTQARRGLY
ncbi:transglycosylase SLT domain-containing protein [Halovulum sp. GXIMD14793]